MDSANENENLLPPQQTHQQYQQTWSANTHLSHGSIHRSGSMKSFLYAPRNSISGLQNPQISITSNSTSIGKPTLSRKNYKSTERPDVFAKALSEKLYSPWIEQVFHRRECIKFIPDSNTDRCGCGRLSSAHSQLALSRFTTSLIKSKESTSTRSSHPLAQPRPHEWNILEHTEASPTDAFGTIEFQGSTHAHKAHYVRIGFDSNPEDIMYLMEKVWGLQRPRLVITVHGGTTNFQYDF